MNMPYDRIAEHIVADPIRDNFINNKGVQVQEGRGDGTDGDNEGDVYITQIGNDILGTPFKIVTGQRIVARLAEFSEDAKRRRNERNCY